MKTALCALLALLLLVGCSAAPQPEQTQPVTADPGPVSVPSTVEPEPPGPGLYELCRYTAGDSYRPITMAARDDRAVVVLCRTPADPAQQTAYIQTLDPATGETGPILPLEGSEDEDAYSLSIEADGSLVYYNPYAETAAHYSPDGKLLGQIENPHLAADDPQFPHALISPWFSFQDSAAVYHSYNEGEYLFSAYAFADEPDALYLLDGGFDSLCFAEGRLLLESDYLRDNAGLAFRVLDLDAGKELDRLTVENDAVGEAREFAYLYQRQTALCSAGVLLWVEQEFYEPGVEYGESGPEPDWEERICLWRLDEAAAQSVDLRRVTAEELRAENEAIAARIAERYEITVLLDTAPEGDLPPLMAGDDPEEYKDAELITGIGELPAYELLRQTERFLALLPEGFTHEMQADYPAPRYEDGMTGVDGFDIFIIKEIPGGSGAYANAWGERLKIVLATDEFSASTLPHEFMHLIERRVEAYYDSVGESFWEGWEALNPEDFDYYDGEDHAALVYEYFVSDYATTNTQEDYAETFMYLFMAREPLGECFWYQDAPHIQAKTAYLIEAIRRSFPSVQAVDEAYWERG